MERRALVGRHAPDKVGEALEEVQVVPSLLKDSGQEGAGVLRGCLPPDRHVSGALHPCRHSARFFTFQIKVACTLQASV